MPSLLRIQSLTKVFEIARGTRIHAVDGVDLEVGEGETLGLVGESGSGKTTLARCALRLSEPTSGSIEFDGTDILSLSQAELRRRRPQFQIIFQDPSASLNPRWTVARILSEPFEVHGLGSRQERNRWVGELLEAVALDSSLIDRTSDLLSGGQQQRLVIARALALKPRLLIADEPVSALDASVQAQILNLLADLQKRFSLTLILISHSFRVVHYLSTRVAVMYLGRIVEEAPASAFFQNPKHPYSRGLLACMPSLGASDDAAIKGLPGEIPSPLQPPSGCHFHPRCPEVNNRCRQEYPCLSAIGDESRVACFLYTKESRAL